MTAQGSLGKASLELSLGQIVAQAIVFLRSVAVARLLGPDEFGIATALIVTSAFFEMLGHVNLDQLLIQARDGDDEGLQANAHAMQMLRGICLTFAVLLLADPAARLMNLPEHGYAFRVLALVPLLTGLRHLDVKRFHRRLNVRADVLIDVSMQVTNAVVAITVAYLTRSFAAVLAGILAQWTVWSVASQLVAHRPFRIAFTGPLFARLWRFGWPLGINSVLLFFTFQGDRVVTGSFFDTASLSAYAIAYSITSLPTTVASRICSGLALPWLSTAQLTPDVQLHRIRTVAVLLALAAAVVCGSLAAAGGTLVTWCYGARFATAPAIIPLLALAQACWLVRVGIILAALSVGDTRTSMYSNVARVSGVVIAATLAAAGAGLEGIAISALVGELAAIAIALRCVSHSHGLSAGIWLAPALLTLLSVGVASAACLAMQATVHLSALSLVNAACTATASVLMFVLAFPVLRGLARDCRLLWRRHGLRRTAGPVL